MGFTKPVPPYTLIGVGVTLFQPPHVFLDTMLTAVGRYPSIVVVPSWSPASVLGFTTMTVSWYGDPLGATLVGQEQYAIAPFRKTQILTQVKAPFVDVSMGYSAGETASLNVFSSDAQVDGFERFDTGAGGALVNFAGVAGITLPNNTAGASTFMIGAAKSPQQTLLCQVVPGAGVTTTTTLTITADLFIPNGFNGSMDIGSVTAAPITTPTTAGGPVCTAPIALPAMPPGGLPFDLDLTATLSAPDPARNYQVNAFVY